jgi:hypothetical protein
MNAGLYTDAVGAPSGIDGVFQIQKQGMCLIWAESGNSAVGILVSKRTRPGQTWMEAGTGGGNWYFSEDVILIVP